MFSLISKRILPGIGNARIAPSGLSFSLGQWRAGRTRAEGAMPATTSAFYCVVLAIGLCTAAYTIWWRQNWFDALLAAAAATMILVPFFVRREFAFVAGHEREAKANLKAQMLASNDRLRLVREHDMAILSDLRAGATRQLERAYQDHTQLQLENEHLKAKLLPFLPEGRKRERGRFVRSKLNAPRLTIDSVGRLVRPDRDETNSAMPIARDDLSKVAPGQGAIVPWAKSSGKSPLRARSTKTNEECAASFLITIDGVPPFENVFPD